MIHLEDIAVTFGKGTVLETKALESVNLSIAEGEFVTVIGSNGAGKSTLLNSLSGDVRVDSGAVHIGHLDVTEQETHDRANLVARVFQDPMAGTCATLSIEENMAIALSRGQSRGLKVSITREVRDRFRQELSRLNLGLEDRLREPIGRLSGGQRQAISLIMAVMNPTKILLLDEHTAALDPKTAAFVMGLTQEIINERKLTTLMVTHSMQQALSHGTRTIMMHQGRIIFDCNGPERTGYSVADLLKLFDQTGGPTDRMVLS